MKDLTSKLLTWYAQSHRDLPWRHTSNPYEIWVSEMILQQTRVEQGQPYYVRFLDKFPQITDLANAHETEVLKIWQGLGYYARARNMHKTAQWIVQNFGGAFPSEYRSLVQLKGIGPYTAAAIASFAFKEVVPAIDGNVKRVVARLFNIAEDISTVKFQQQAFLLLMDVIPKEAPDIFNQATMELGARICTPRNPSCVECPLLDHCESSIKGTTAQIPYKKPKSKPILKHLAFVQITKGAEVLIRQRPSEGIWGGLYEYPYFEFSGTGVPQFPSKECIWDSSCFESVPLIWEQQQLHKLSHQHFNAHLFSVDVVRSNMLLDGLGIWVKKDQLKSFPLHKLMLKFVSE